MSGDRTPGNRERAARMFVAGVTVGAVIGLVVLASCGPVAHIDGRWLQLGLLTLLVVLFEANPVTVARTDGVQTVVASTTFVFAIFAMFGPGPAIVAQAIASIISDAREHKGPLKTLFNVAQHTMSWSLAGIVFCVVLGDQMLVTDGEFGWRWSLAMVLAAATYFLVNNTIVAAIVTISGTLPLATNVREMVVGEIVSDVVLLALAPI